MTVTSTAAGSTAIGRVKRRKTCSRSGTISRLRTVSLLGAGVTHQSSFFIREDNAVEAPGYTRLDAALFYELSDALLLQVNVENITDTDYFPDAHSNDNITTGEPVNARFTISGRF